MQVCCEPCFQSNYPVQPCKFLIDSPEGSCLTCNIIKLTLRTLFPPCGPKHKIKLHSENTDLKHPITTQLQLNDPQDEEDPCRILYYTRSEDESATIARDIGYPFQFVPVRRDLEVSPSGKASLQQIRIWDTICQKSHLKCTLGLPKLPTRVIDVGLSANKCCLHESINEYQNYVTLSHCWGSLTFPTTRKDNIEAHKNDIDLATLPKTFQDAVEVTRFLGIQYLWIDSLCIIQDDLDDWATESSKMASVYQNSYLTLAATGAKDGSEGLFKHREAEICKIELASLGYTDSMAALMARKARKHNCYHSINYYGEMQDETESEFLMKRAWVYQERLLTRRLLHFASDEMIWECRTSAECECGFVKRDEAPGVFKIDGGYERDISDRSVFESLVNGGRRDPEAETQRWYRLIQNYTSLSMTKQEDRLPAISGIASSLMAAEDYVAGLRSHCTVRDLMWFSIGYKPRRPSTYVAPSWSWASVIGRVGHQTAALTIATSQWDKPGSSVLVEILEIKVAKSTSDPFGRVKSGELQIRGRPTQGVILARDAQGTFELTSDQLDLEISSQPGVKLHQHGLIIDTYEDIKLVLSTPVFLLPMFSTNKSLYHLVLIEYSPSPQRFRRVGSTNFDLTIGPASGASMLKKLLGESQPTVLVIV